MFPWGHLQPRSLVSARFDICLFLWLLILHSPCLLESLNLYLLSLFSTLCFFSSACTVPRQPRTHLSLTWHLAPCTRPSLCLYIYMLWRVLLLVINTQVKWPVTLPAMAKRQRYIDVAGTVPTFPSNRSLRR